MLENIIKLAKENLNFRKVIYTGEQAQVVLMSLLPGEDIGEESHDGIDQILFVVRGRGQADLNGQLTEFSEGDLLFVPAGTMHNVKNAGESLLKLFTVYAPPNHPDKTIHKTRQEAMEEEE